MRAKTGRLAKTTRFRKFVDERLNHKIFVYLTEEQYSSLIGKANEQEVSVSCLIRKKLKEAKLI